MARVLWSILIVAHVLAAIAWWWTMPAGFPLDHPRFWLHRVVPWVIVAFLIVDLLARAKPLRPAHLAALPATYLAAAVTGRVLFPSTLARLWFVPLAVGLVLAGLWWWQHHAHWRRALACAVPGIVLGVFLARAQQGPAPSTHPVNVAFAEREAAGPTQFRAGPLAFWVDPVLRFVSRSPDACWTVLASNADRTGPVDERSTMSLRVDERILDVDATSSVPHAVYTHLNTYAVLSIEGHRRLFLAFSPAPQTRIEILPSDYPTGRPARFAYVAADRSFHVVEAADAEKGPFTDLATGRLATGDALAIDVYDEQTLVARITFDDFAAQASTELSPTAGWGVPQNAVAFTLGGDAPSSTAHIYLTLAGTGVGRGFESVAHAAGVYRNRMRVERISP